jgi:hypothetical protein
VRLRKLSIDGEKTLQGVAELAYQRSIRSRRRPLLGPVCPRNELVFLTYFTTLRLTYSFADGLFLFDNAEKKNGESRLRSST